MSPQPFVSGDVALSVANASAGRVSSAINARAAADWLLCGG